MEATSCPYKTHHGRNLKRFREMGIRQEALAARLRDDRSQKKISVLQANETMEPKLLDELAQALKGPTEAISHFSEEAVFNVINSTLQDFHDHTHASALTTSVRSIRLNKLLKSEREKVGCWRR